MPAAAPLTRALAAASAVAALALGAYGAAPASAQEPPPPECPNVPTCVNWAFETARYVEDQLECVDCTPSVHEIVARLIRDACPEGCEPPHDPVGELVEELGCEVEEVVFGWCPGIVQQRGRNR